jgi:hypothetical protein
MLPPPPPIIRPRHLPLFLHAAFDGCPLFAAHDFAWLTLLLFDFHFASHFRRRCFHFIFASFRRHFAFAAIFATPIAASHYAYAAAAIQLSFRHCCRRFRLITPLQRSLLRFHTLILFR